LTKHRASDNTVARAVMSLNGKEDTMRRWYEIIALSTCKCLNRNCYSPDVPYLISRR